MSKITPHTYHFGYEEEVCVISTRPLPQWALTALKVHFSPRKYPDPQLKFPFMGEDEGPDISRMEKPTIDQKTGMVVCPVCGPETDGRIHKNRQGEPCRAVWNRTGTLVCPVCGAGTLGEIHISPQGETCTHYFENGAWKSLRVG